MHEGLSSTKGYASATILHHGALLFDLCHQRFHRPFLAAHFQGGGWTFLRAATADGAGFLHNDAVGCETKELLRTDADACLTADALGLLVEYLRLWCPALRVMTPHAAHRTAF